MPSLNRAQQDSRILNRQVRSLLARSARYFPYCREARDNISFKFNLLLAFYMLSARKKILLSMPFLNELIKNELLFRHIFETQIHIQTQIPKTLKLALTTNGFL